MFWAATPLFAYVPLNTIMFFAAAWLWYHFCLLRAQNSSSSAAVSADGVQQGHETIKLLTLLPYFNPIASLNPSWAEGDNIRPAMNLAVDQINRSPYILDNFTLDLVHSSDGCDISAETSLGFVQQAFMPGARFTGIIGPGCSSSTFLLAPVTQNPKFSLVSLHGGGSPAFSDRRAYPLHLGTLGSTMNFVTGFNKLLSKSKWARIALFYDDSRLYYLTTKRLFSKNLPASISLFVYPVSSAFLPLDFIQNELLRVVFVMCPEVLSRRIVCLAKNQSMLHSDYQFVIMSQAPDDLAKSTDFTFNLANYHCTRDEMLEALDMVFFLNFQLKPDDEDALTVSNTTYSEYLLEYWQYIERYNQQSDLHRNSTYSIWSTYFYDAVWAWALVLDNLTESRDDFVVNSDYGNTAQSRIIAEQFYHTSFQGMSGDIQFSEMTGYSTRKVDISRLQNSTQTTVAIIHANGELEVVDSDLEFIEDSFPNETLRENQALAIGFTSMAAVQLCITAFLQIMTTVCRKKPSIKANSVKLLHMSYVGVYIVLLAAFLFSLNQAVRISMDKRNIFCALLWNWGLPLGFTLAFCPVVVRTWRVYRIFKHYLNPGPFISDRILIAIVMAMLLIDLIIATTWSALDFYVTREVVIVIPGEGGEINTLGVRSECFCEHLEIWGGFFYSIKFIILFVVTILALLTRNILNPTFATSSLRVLVYLMVVFFPLGFTIYFMIIFFNLDGPRNNPRFAVLCIQLNLLCFLCITCIFVPPLLPIMMKQKKLVPIFKQRTS